LPSLAVLIPVLGRPQNVAPLVESLDLSVERERGEGWDIWTVFVCSHGDHDEIAAVVELGLVPLFHGGSYAAKINYAASCVPCDWYLTAADDLRFHNGWLRAAIDRHIETGALVIGTNDLHNPSVVRGHYATHLLIHRDYVERGTIDEPGKIFCELYRHNCVDTEAVETAKVRQQFAFASLSHVEHLHPIFKGAPDDDTYRLGREHHLADKRLLAERRRLWTRTGVERRRLRLVPQRR